MSATYLIVCEGQGLKGPGVTAIKPEAGRSIPG